MKVSFLSFLVSPSTDCEDEADLHPLPPTTSRQLCPHQQERAHPELPCSA